VLQVHKVRAKMIAALREEFNHLDLTYSIGGQISFDLFPTVSTHYSHMCAYNLHTVHRCCSKFTDWIRALARTVVESITALCV
jgi:Eukaryotic phosphomannomutase